MKRRILLTTDVVGGVWDFCMTLAAGLHARGDEAVLLALGTPSQSQQRAAAHAEAHLISEPLKLEWMADSTDDVRHTRDMVAHLARDLAVDVVHANQFAAACIDVDVPVVLTLHSDVLSWRRWVLATTEIAPEWQAYVALVRDALARADRVVAVSRFLADEVTDLYGTHRPVDFIHNGWPVPASQDGSRERAGTVAAGRIWDAAKNIPLVAEAAHGWNPGPVYLAGETSHPDGGRAHVSAPLQPLGFLNRTELDQLLCRARVYVSAARYDPFGLLPLQAALHGCMLLLSDIPSYREVWGDTACYFDPNDALGLRAAWETTLTRPYDPRARQHAQTRLSAERMVADYQRVYARTSRMVAV